jgi:hypothetical protein
MVDADTVAVWEPPLVARRYRERLRAIDGEPSHDCGTRTPATSVTTALGTAGHWHTNDRFDEPGPDFASLLAVASSTTLSPFSKHDTDTRATGWALHRPDAVTVVETPVASTTTTRTACSAAAVHVSVSDGRSARLQHRCHPRTSKHTTLCRCPASTQQRWGRTQTMRQT